MLSSFLHAAVVAQPSLTAAVAWVLAHRLDGSDGGALDPVRSLFCLYKVNREMVVAWLLAYRLKGSYSGETYWTVVLTW